MVESIVIILSGVIVVLIVFVGIMYRLGLAHGSRMKELHWEQRVGGLRRDIANTQRHVVKGKLAEVFAPFLPGFQYRPSEAKFIGDPIDYLIFEGLDVDEITGIRFVEVKSADARLSIRQKKIKKLIESINDERISFEEFRFEG